jgi:hypothetical protein
MNVVAAVAGTAVTVAAVAVTTVKWWRQWP